MNRLMRLLAIFAVLISLGNTVYADNTFQLVDENDPLAGCDACFDDLKPKEKKKLPKKPRGKKKSPKTPTK